MFTERDAILMEMKELKEDSRLATQLYLDSKMQISSRYNELQDRLRQIDERDLKAPIVTPKVEPEKPHISKNQDMSVMDLELDRVTEKKRALVPFTELVPAVELFLQQNGGSKISVIKEHIENKYNAEWVNFSNVMKNVANRSESIGIDKDGKNFIYFYKY